MAKQGNLTLTALTMPAVMIGNAVVFLSVFSGITKLMEAKVGMSRGGEARGGRGKGGRVVREGLGPCQGESTCRRR